MFKKIIKYSLIATFLLVTFVVFVIAITLNLIFTPEKITPKVIQAVNNNLNAELQVESVELTFFSTFPDFSLEMKNGVLLKEIDEDDSLKNPFTVKKDSLVAFGTCLISLNPIAFLKKNKIDIHEISFIKPQIYAYINKEGVANWDILKNVVNDTVVVEQDTNAFDAEINLENITITEGNLYYDDRNTRVFGSLQDLNLNLSAYLNEEAILLDLQADAGNIIFWQEGETLVKEISIALVTNLKLNRKAKILDIENSKLNINDMEFLANGRLTPDTVKKELGIQLELALEAPSLKDLMAQIPAGILKQGDDITTKGAVSLQAKINGTYGNGKLPTVEAGISIKNGAIRYKNMPNTLDLIEMEISALLDPTKEKPSWINVNKFNIRGTSTSISIEGEAYDLLGNTYINGAARGSVDFSALAQTLPLHEGIAVRGLLDVNLDGSLFLQDVMNNDYGKIDAVGKLKLSEVMFTYFTDSLIFETKAATATLGQKQKSKGLKEEELKVFGGVVDLKGVKLNAKHRVKASIESLHVGFKSTPWKDSTRITNINSTITIKKLHFNLADTLQGMMGKGSALINLKSSAEDKTIPAIHTEFKIDSTGVTANGQFIGIKEGVYNFDLIRKGPKSWPATGYIAFNSLYAYSPFFPLLVKMPSTKVSIKPGLIELNGARLVIGRSDLEVTGKLFDLEKTLLEKKTLRAEMVVKSDSIDINELVKTLNEGVSLDEATIEAFTAADSQQTADSTSMRTFVVPKGLDLRFESNFSKVFFGELEIDNLQGLITIKDQNIHLANLQLETMAADMATSLRYEAKDTKNASMNFDFELTDVDIENLLSLIPALDTLFPMANAFEGKVNFKMQGQSKLDEKMGIEIASLQTIARIKGKNLVILDGETFSDLSKTLMFKNKERNLIDSLSFEIMIDGNVMEVFPSLVHIDRYEIAIGGQHKLDMTYNYHVSVLKSPMPFKAGIDLSGDLEDYDFKVTKAKYKYLFSDKKKHQEKADPELLKRKNAILSKLQF